jgi:FkbM family methyltransferase
MKRRRLVVQAGGCLGFVPGKLAGLFDSVLTFEPDHKNYALLHTNCGMFPNVTARHAALGFIGKVGVHRDADNLGASRVVEGDAVESVSIDSLGLAVCDAIILDVEGHEPVVIERGLQTIGRCRPELIVAETVGPEMTAELVRLGYRRGPDYGGDASFERGA